MLHGHEGGPLVVGGIMYVHTPFPNITYAIDLDNPNKILCVGLNYTTHVAETGRGVGGGR